MIYVIHLKNVEKLGLGPYFQKLQFEKGKWLYVWTWIWVSINLGKWELYTNLFRLAHIRRIDKIGKIVEIGYLWIEYWTWIKAKGWFSNDLKPMKRFEKVCDSVSLVL